jgi:hypothetical protein
MIANYFPLHLKLFLLVILSFTIDFQLSGLREGGTSPTYDSCSYGRNQEGKYS